MAFQNFFATKLFTDIGASDTTITLETVPTATSGRLVIEARNASQREIVKYTGVAGNTITGVTRGEGGTSATTHLKNALVEMNATSEDLQDLYDAFASFSASATDWRDTAVTPSLVSYSGQRSYPITVPSDLTGSINPGMRIRTTRSVAAPTRSTLLNGTTQYWVKTAPNKLSFTDDFVVSAWVKLTSYPTNGSIVSRFNGSSGWALTIDSTGRVVMFGHNAGAGNFSDITSRQSVPLGKWVHVTGQLDMSTFTAAPTTSYIMIDGVDVPAVVSRAGTNPTSLVQAGNLEIGSYNGGGSFFPGKIAQVAIYNGKVLQSNIRATISQGLTGTETSLASAYSFDNSTTDLNTTTPNDLTAGAGAPTATNADSPFGVQANWTVSSVYDYGIVQSINATTIVVQVPEGCTIPTAGAISALHYSGAKSPQGFPTQKSRWLLQTILRQQISMATGTGGAWIPSSAKLPVPIGSWVIRRELNVTQQNTSNGMIQNSTRLNSAAGVLADSISYRFINVGSLVDDIHLQSRSSYFETSVADTLTYEAACFSGAGTTTFVIRGDVGQGEITAEPAGL